MNATDHYTGRVGGRLLVVPGDGAAGLGRCQASGGRPETADVVMAGALFGQRFPGQVAQALLRLGIRVVVAESFAPQFVEQAQAAGLLLAESHYPLHEGFEDGDCVELDTRRGHLRDAHGSAAYPLRILDRNTERSQVA